MRRSHIHAGFWGLSGHWPQRPCARLALAGPLEASPHDGEAGARAAHFLLPTPSNNQNIPTGARSTLRGWRLGSTISSCLHERKWVGLEGQWLNRPAGGLRARSQHGGKGEEKSSQVRPRGWRKVSDACPRVPPPWSQSCFRKNSTGTSPGLRSPAGNTHWASCMWHPALRHGWGTITSVRLLQKTSSVQPE